MNFKKMPLLLIAMIIPCLIFGQGINFCTNDMATARKLSKEENKIIFIDIYADWCGPCKMLDSQVFSKEDIGSYYNKNFICCKINGELPANKEFVNSMQIKGYPTMAYIKPDGTVAFKHTGVLGAYNFLRIGRELMNELKSPEEMYKLYKSDKSNLANLQDILIDAPFFMPGIKEQSQQRRWQIRLEDLYKEYVITKGFDSMINDKDFQIITLYHNAFEKNDPVLAHMLSSLEKWQSAVSSDQLLGYMSQGQMNLILTLAQKGDDGYTKELQRLKGDMKPIYDKLYPDIKDFYSVYMSYADANKYLYKEKNGLKYGTEMEKYFKFFPSTKMEDYLSAVQNAFVAFNGALDITTATKCEEWIGKAFTFKPELKTEVTLKIALGDCYSSQGKPEIAKIQYTEAYNLMLKTGDSAFISSIQSVITQKLKALEVQVSNK